MDYISDALLNVHSLPVTSEADLQQRISALSRFAEQVDEIYHLRGMIRVYNRRGHDRYEEEEDDMLNGCEQEDLRTLTGE